MGQQMPAFRLRNPVNSPTLVPMKHVVMQLAISALAMTAWISEAKVAVDPMFTDHLVLQRDVAVPVWGTAEPGETVTVQYVPQPGGKNASRKVETRAADDGKWRVDLKPMSASNTGGRLVITGNKSDDSPVEFQDVLVGEVWLGSGQSNMAYPVKNYADEDSELRQAVEGGPYPNLRLHVHGKWVIAGPENIPEFSAMLFSFGHALHRELQVPIGLMVGAVNGTPSGSWLTEQMASDSPELVAMFKMNSGFESFEAMATDWNDKRAKFKEEVKQATQKDRKRMRFSHPGQPIGYHFKKIEMHIPYAIRGVLWDQGEGHTGIPGVDQYTVMKALIAGWRKAWGIQDMPFLHIQKPSGGGCAWEPSSLTGRKVPMPWEPLPAEPLPEDRNCALNLAHIKMGTIKNAPLVTTSDLTPGVHPVHKYSYGKRACRVALGTVYGRDIATCGPVYQSHTVKGAEIEIAYDHIGKGLAFRHGDKLQGFEIAGDDLKWEWADAVIKGDTVIVSSNKIAHPRHVRYAFNQTFPWANLFNQDGLPALMFTTSQK
jgi:sialate O-acetylesterase